VGLSVEGPGAAPSTSTALGELSWEELDRSYVTHLLERCRWNVTRAAERAGVKRTTFAARMRKLGISRG